MLEASGARMKQETEMILIDDDKLVCEGIKAGLSSVNMTKIVGVFHCSEDALEFLKTQSVDLAIIDYYMPGLHGIELITELKKHYPNLKLIILTSEKNPYLLRQIVETGVNALLVKGASHLLEEAVKAVICGETWLQPDFGIAIYHAEKDIQVMNTLTNTQRICLEQIAMNKSIDEIAKLQNTTPNTVNDRLLQCRKKLGVSTTEALIDRYHELFPTEKNKST